jgi:proteic killer suppression protein
LGRQADKSLPRATAAGETRLFIPAPENVSHRDTDRLTFVSLRDTVTASTGAAMAIQSFRSQDLEAIFDHRRPGRRFPTELVRVTLRKLEMLNAATTLTDLKAPPNNRLEALTDDRKGSHSIRVNDQFRLCFRWTPAGPADVEFVDYH